MECRQRSQIRRLAIPQLGYAGTRYRSAIIPRLNPGDFDSAFAAIREQRPDGMLTLGDPLTVTMRNELASFALQERLPTVFTHRQFVEVGGLISYGANFPDLLRRA